MHTTKDYTRLNEEAWIATILRVHYDEALQESERITVQEREFVSKEEAEKFLTHWMPLYSQGTTDDIHGDIEYGVFIDASFNDGTYGHVRHATLDLFDYPRAYVHISASGTTEIEWETDE